MADSIGNAARWLPAARAGSPEALGQLLDGCRDYLRLVADRELDPDLRAKGGVSDLVQETMLDAVRDFHQFRGSTEAELLAWLRCLLRNNLVSFTRLFRETGKRQVDREVHLSSGLMDAEGLSPSGHAAANEESLAIQQGLARLPDNYRQVLQLRYQEELSFEEIGQRMSLSGNAARKLWLRAVRCLQQETEPPA